MKKDVFLAGGVRTPIGSFFGMFSDVNAVELGTTVAKAAIERSGIDGKHVEEVAFGNCIGDGLGQNPARQIAIHAGLDPSVPASTLSKMCGSGMKVVMNGAQAILADDLDVVLAGGTENMTRAPYLLQNGRSGYRMGDGVLIDSLMFDGLWDSFTGKHMGMFGEQCAREFDFTREAQDAFAVESYHRAIKAQDAGIFAKEITGVEVKTRKGSTVFELDEELGKFNEEKFTKLRPAFSKEGTVTPGNASSISDGASAIMVVSGEKVKELGITPQAKILGYTSFSREPEWFTRAPVDAVRNLMKKLSWSVSDVDLFELNEAFAVVPMSGLRELDIPHEKLNVHGGAIAIGHPIGASGCRVIVTLLNALEHHNLKTGIAALCIGGGEAVALAVERV